MLASAQSILSLNPIEGADNIETAKVLGWDVVVKKGEFKVGDLVSYIQIDTIVPETEQFEFLRERSFRVRTIKLRKQISQGLIVPLPKGKWKEGDDLTDILGVKKYNKPEEKVVERKIPVRKTWFGRLWQRFQFTVLFKLFPSLKDKLYPPMRGDFPSHIISRTDEERIQNIPDVLGSHRGKVFVVSEKLDGSSVTVIRGNKGLRVCSRNFEIIDKRSDYWAVALENKFDLHLNNISNLFCSANIAVQGEYIGKPQGNKYKLEKNEIRLFNIYVDGKRLNQKKFYEVCSALQIPSCPFIAQLELNFTMEEIIKYAEGKSKLNDKVEREGLVFRCIEDNLSFKVISNKFLLKNNE